MAALVILDRNMHHENPDVSFNNSSILEDFLTHPSFLVRRPRLLDCRGIGWCQADKDTGRGEVAYGRKVRDIWACVSVSVC